MADIAIKMGVNAPPDDVEGVLKVLNFIYEQDPSEDGHPFRFSAYEENFSDGAHWRFSQYLLSSELYC